jgi:hypothetical protein
VRVDQSARGAQAGEVVAQRVATAQAGAATAVGRQSTSCTVRLSSASTSFSRAAAHNMRTTPTLLARGIGRHVICVGGVRDPMDTSTRRGRGSAPPTPLSQTRTITLPLSRSPARADGWFGERADAFLAIQRTPPADAQKTSDPGGRIAPPFRLSLRSSARARTTRSLIVPCESQLGPRRGLPLRLDRLQEVGKPSARHALECRAERGCRGCGRDAFCRDECRSPRDA